MGFWLFFSYGFVFINGDTWVGFLSIDAERGNRTLMNDTVRTGLNRVRLPIPPSPQGDATKWSQIMIRPGFQRQSLLFNEKLLAPS